MTTACAYNGTALGPGPLNWTTEPCNEVRLTHFITPSHFYLQFQCDYPQYVAFQDHLARLEPKTVRKHALEIGDIVLVKTITAGVNGQENDEWRRAIMRNCDRTAGKYVCWLMDEGVFFMADVIYNLPPHFCERTAFAVTCALNNLVGAQYILQPNTASYELHSKGLWTEHAIRLTYGMIRSASKIGWWVERRGNRVEYGHLILTHDTNSKVSLSDLLVTQHLATIDKMLFEKHIKSELTENELVRQCGFDEYEANTIGYYCGPTVNMKICPYKSKTEGNVKWWLDTNIVNPAGDNMQNGAQNGDADTISIDVHDATTGAKVQTITMPRSQQHELGSTHLQSTQIVAQATATTRAAEETRVVEEQYLTSMAGLLQIHPAQSAKPEVNANSPRSRFEILKSRLSSHNTSSNVSGSTKSESETLETPTIANGNGCTSENKDCSENTTDNELGASNASFKAVQNGPDQLCICRCKSSVNDPSGIFCTYCNINRDLKITIEDKKVPLPKYKTAPPIQAIQINFSAKCRLFNVDENRRGNVVYEAITANGYKIFRTTLDLIPAVMVHSTCLFEPATTFPKLPLENVHQAFTELQYSTMRGMQIYGVPSVMHRLNTILVGHASSGKTISYLPIVLSFAMEYKRAPAINAKSVITPLAIIMCAQSQRATDVYALLEKFVSCSTNHAQIALAISPIAVDQMQKWSLSNVDIVVCTPSSTMWLLKHSSFSLDELRHFVMSDGDELLAGHTDTVCAVNGHVASMLVRRQFRETVQVIVTARHWTRNLHTYAQKLYRTPSIIIADPFEAVLYAGISLRVCTLNREHKLDMIFEKVKADYHLRRTIVVCDTVQETATLSEMLLVKGVSTTMVNRSISDEENAKSISAWLLSAHNLTVLVCDDESLFKRYIIRNACVLIHYSVPPDWQAFVKRFQTLLDTCQSPLNIPQQQCSTETLVCVDRCANRNWNRLSRYMHFMGIEQPIEFMEHIKIQADHQNTNDIAGILPLCDRIKVFGECFDVSCARRHSLRESANKLAREVFNDPVGRIVYLKILSATGVGRFCAMPIKCNSVDEIDLIVAEQDAAHNEFNARVLSVVKKKCSKTPIEGPVQAFQWYVYKGPDTYHRCCALEEDHNPYNEQRKTEVNICRVDIGDVVRVSIKNLYELPDVLKQLPPIFVEVVLVNVVPTHGERNWSATKHSKFEKHIHSILKEASDQLVILQGTLKLKCDNTYWLDNAEVKAFVPKLNEMLPLLDLGPYLISKGLAVLSAEPLDNLRKMLYASGIRTPNQNVTNSVPQAQPQWETLEQRSWHMVYCTTVVQPDSFYVRLAQFNAKLLNLHAHISRMISVPFYPLKVSRPTEGEFYLAPNPNESPDQKSREDDVDYIRVLLLSIDTREKKGRCFSVDYGDTFYIYLIDLRFLRNDLIQCLPFQAIRCNLQDVYSPKTDIAGLFQQSGEFFLYSSSVTRRQSDHANAVGQNVDHHNVYMFQRNGDDVYFMNEEIETVAKPNQGRPISAIKEMFDDFLKSRPVQNCLNENKIKDNRVLAKNASTDSKSASSSALFPEVDWHQTATHIHIYYRIPAVEDYQIKIAFGRILSLAAYADGKKYVDRFSLFGKCKHDFAHHANANHLEATLEKCTPAEWSQLIIKNPQDDANRFRRIKHI